MLVQVVCMWDLPTYRENVAGKYSVGWDACMYVGSRCVGESTCYIETDTNVCSCSFHVCFDGVFFSSFFPRLRKSAFHRVFCMVGCKG